MRMGEQLSLVDAPIRARLHVRHDEELERRLLYELAKRRGRARAIRAEDLERAKRGLWHRAVSCLVRISKLGQTGMEEVIGQLPLKYAELQRNAGGDQPIRPPLDAP